MARPLKPLVRGGGYYPSNKWTPLVYPGGYTTANGGGQPEPEAVLKTVTGSLIHITDALALPAEALSVNVEPIQDLHGYDSPWPAGGGNSVIDFESIFSEGWTNENGGLKATYSKGYITVTGTNNTSGWINIVSYTGQWYNDPLTLPAGTYSTADHINISCSIDGGSYGNKSGTITANTSVEIRGFYIAVNTGQTVNWKVPMVVAKGSTVPTTFFPYSNICPISGRTSATIYHSGADTSDPTTYTIQLGDTVYGGTLDVVSGKLTVDRAMVDLGSLRWAYNTTYAFFTSNSISDRKIGVLNIVSDLFKTEAGSWTGTPKANALWGNGSNATIYVQTPPIDNVSDFMTLVNGHQLVYELATPIEITLTPTQIDMLLGTNNLWADAGDSTLTYYADGNASTSEALGILLGGTYNNPGGADDASDDEALGILLGGS